MKPEKLQSNWIQSLRRIQISSYLYKRGVIVMVMSMFFIGMSSHAPYSQKKQEEVPQKPAAVKRPVALSTAEMEKAMIKAGEEINKQFSKYDSVLNQQEKNVENLQGIVKDQTYINNRLKKILSRFPKDSVEKYEMELAEPEKVKTETNKKKIELPEIEVPKRKKGFFKRIFGKKN